VLSHKRGQESNLGDFITDAMVDWVRCKALSHHDSLSLQFAQRSTSEFSWTPVAIAVTNSGGIRSSFERGDITESDLLTVLPFGNTIVAVSLTGEDLKAMLEFAAGRVKAERNATGGNGGFLQVSGLRYVLDARRPVGERVSHLRARCAQCLSPRYRPVELGDVYRVAVNSYMLGGGDGHEILKTRSFDHSEGRAKEKLREGECQGQASFPSRSRRALGRGRLSRILRPSSAGAADAGGARASAERGRSAAVPRAEPEWSKRRLAFLGRCLHIGRHDGQVPFSLSSERTVSSEQSMLRIT